MLRKFGTQFATNLRNAPPRERPLLGISEWGGHRPGSPEGSVRLARPCSSFRRRVLTLEVVSAEDMMLVVSPFMEKEMLADEAASSWDAQGAAEELVRVARDRWHASGFWRRGEIGKG